MEYARFIESKAKMAGCVGLKEPFDIADECFDFQHDIIRWALKRGRAAIFADCGLGKTLMQLVWAKNIPGRVLILAPLAVASQTIREGAKFGISATYCRDQQSADESGSQIIITNYEMLEKFDPTKYTGVVLDESSILKSYTGKFRNLIIDSFQETPYRLACTATPAPNDFMELGNHAEFLGAMSRVEMLSMFFVHDGGETQKWRLKGHAEEPFWKWLCSWSVMIRKPSDIGYDDGGFILPEMVIHQHQIKSEAIPEGFLFAVEAQTLQERQQARRASTDERVKECAGLITDNDPWLIWCNMNDESAKLTKSIQDAVEVKGSDKQDVKEQRLIGFSDGDIRVMVTKPSIAGFGMNWQHCSNMAFVGLSDSYEQFYQAVRRCWRFGQKKTVNVHVITADTEGAVVRNIQRKEADAERMASEMVKHMAVINAENIKGFQRESTNYDPVLSIKLPNFLKGAS